MPRLNISYSIDQEVERVRYTVKKLPWYAEQGYSLERINLPARITEDSSDGDIVRAVTSEYIDSDYAECALKLQQEWARISVGFKEMRHEPSFHVNGEYGVLLTKYSMGGSYNPDKNQVIVKIAARTQGGTAGLVAHEIVHMTIQYLIDQYHVRHWRKERLVDLIMERYFPGLKKMQNIKEDVAIVDQSFEKYFPDMEAIARAIGD